MTVPLQVLGVRARSSAASSGMPGQLFGRPSSTGSSSFLRRRSSAGALPRSRSTAPSVAASSGLLIALVGRGGAGFGIWLADRFYFGAAGVRAAAAARRALPRPLRAVANKYYVDEIYDATVVAGHDEAGAGARGSSTPGWSTARSTAPATSRSAPRSSPGCSTSTWSTARSTWSAASLRAGQPRASGACSRASLQGYALVMAVGAFVLMVACGAVARAAEGDAMGFAYQPAEHHLLPAAARGAGDHLRAAARSRRAAIKTVATVVAGLDFLLSLPLWFLYEPGGAAFQFAYRARLDPVGRRRSTTSASTASRSC